MKSEEEKFKLLDNYFFGKIKVETENINGFNFGSFNTFSSIFKEKLSNHDEKLSHDILSCLKLSKLSNTPEIDDNTIAITSKYCDIDDSFIQSMRKILNNERYIKMAMLNIDEWSEHALNLNIDISNEINKFNLFKNNFNNFNKINDALNYLQEVNGLIQDLSKLENDDINKIEIVKKMREKVSIRNTEKYLFGFNHNRYENDYETIINIKDLINYDDVEKFIKENIIDSIKNKIREKVPSYLLTDAEKYESRKRDSAIQGFLSEKNFEDKIDFKLEMSKSQKYSEIVIFNDKSVIGQQRDGSYKIFTGSDLEGERKTISNDYIAYKLRKKPNIASFFQAKYVMEDYDLNSCLITMNTYLDNEDILKNLKFNLNEYKDTTLESLDDIMSHKIKKAQVIKYAHSITSSKYKNLYDSNTYELFREIKDSGVSQSKIQEMVGKKIAAYKTSDEFNTGLQKILDSINNFDPDIISDKSKNLNINTLYKEDNVYVFKIDNFEQSKAIGSTSWCISRHEHYFESYTENNAVQLFIFDFNKSSKDNKSMIGITLYSDGSYNTAHDKNDSHAYLDDLLKKIQYHIINTNPDLFGKIENNLKESIDKYFGNENKQTTQVNKKMVI